MSNVLQFKPKEKPKLKRKPKIKFYTATYIKKGNIQGWAVNKKQFLKDCVFFTKYMLDYYKPEYFYKCALAKKQLKGHARINSDKNPDNDYNV